MDYATEVDTYAGDVQAVLDSLEVTKNQYRDLVYGIIDFIKKDVTHEGTSATFSPTEILDKIYGMAADLPDVKERAYG